MRFVLLQHFHGSDDDPCVQDPQRISDELLRRILDLPFPVAAGGREYLWSPGFLQAVGSIGEGSADDRALSIHRAFTIWSKHLTPCIPLSVGWLIVPEPSQLLCDEFGFFFSGRYRRATLEAPFFTLVFMLVELDPEFS